MAGAVLIVLIGGAVLLLGGGGTDGQAPLGEGEPTNGTDTPAGPAEESTPEDPTVESVIETADSSQTQISNFTMHFDMRVMVPNGSYVQNRTIRASRDQDRYLLETRERFDSNGTETMVVEQYGTPRDCLRQDHVLRAERDEHL